MSACMPLLQHFDVVTCTLTLKQYQDAYRYFELLNQPTLQNLILNS